MAYNLLQTGSILLIAVLIQVFWFEGGLEWFGEGSGSLKRRAVLPQSSPKAGSAGVSLRKRCHWYAHCNPEVARCLSGQTIFAKGEKTFVELKVSSRWGWQIGPVSPGIERSHELFAGAARVSFWSRHRLLMLL
jgi:hypothetical protein